MKTILQKHIAIYPKMQAQDIYKLLYQAAFAGGHMIASAERSLDFLREETAQIDMASEVQLIEDIGNGLVRLNLKAIDHYAITLEEINAIFVETANSHQGDQTQFLEMLAAVDFPGFIAFHEEMAHKDYPLVSHTAVYKQHYDPHYRVVSQEVLLRVRPDLVK